MDFQEACYTTRYCISRMRSLRLDIVVQEELIGVRANPHLIDLLLPLVSDPGLDHVFCEDVALQEEGMIFLKIPQRLLEASRHLLDLSRVMRFEIVHILVYGWIWINLILDPIQSGHQHSGEGIVRIAGRVRETNFDPLGL